MAKTKCLLYCAKAKPYLWKGIVKPMHTTDTTNPFNYIWKLQKKDSCMYGGYNGTIVVECEVECEDLVVLDKLEYSYWYGRKNTDIEKSCLISDKYWDCVKENTGYALFINDLKSLNRPIKLSDLLKYKQSCYSDNHVKNAPHNMCWVWYEGERYCLISCSSKELCGFLNREATIMFKRHILKGMI